MRFSYARKHQGGNFMKIKLSPVKCVCLFLSPDSFFPLYLFIPDWISLPSANNELFESHLFYADQVFAQLDDIYYA